jgi:hypothetical protein
MSLAAQMNPPGRQREKSPPDKKPQSSSSTLR